MISLDGMKCHEALDITVHLSHAKDDILTGGAIRALPLNRKEWGILMERIADELADCLDLLESCLVRDVAVLMEFFPIEVISVDCPPLISADVVDGEFQTNLLTWDGPFYGGPKNGEG